MKIAMRMGFVVISSLLGLTGCPSGTKCEDVKVTFTTPTADSQVTSPYAVTISARTSDGIAYTFDNATLSVNGTDVGAPTSHADGTATFQVSSSLGTNALEAAVTGGSCQGSGTIPVKQETVTVIAVSGTDGGTDGGVDAGACTGVAASLDHDAGLIFPQDINGDLVLSASDLPSLDAGVQVRVLGKCLSGQQVQLKYHGGTTTVVDGPMSFNASGVATMTAFVAGDQPSYSFTAELLAGTTVLDSLNGAVQIDRTAPVCTFASMKSVYGPSDDTDTADGFQLSVTGTGAEAQAKFTITALNGPALQLSRTISSNLGSASTTFTLPDAGDVHYSVDLTCYDDAGNSSTTPFDGGVEVDYVAPSLVITSPQVPDAGSVNVTASPMIVTGTTDPDAATACAYAGVQKLTCVTIPAGAGTFSIPVPFGTEGTRTITILVTDLAGNSTSESFDVSVTLSGCGMVFNRPAQCPALITGAQVTNNNYPFQSQSKAACVGQPVTLTMSTVLADGGVSAPTQVASSTIGATGLGNLTAPVANGNFVYSASVINPGPDAGVSSFDCPVTVDTTGPSIQQPALNGKSVVTLNSAQDLQAGTPGAQWLLQFTAAVPTGGRVDVCTTQQKDPVSGQNRATSAACTVFPGNVPSYVLQTNVSSPTSGFTFPEGTYSIKIVVVGGGVASESDPLPLFVDVTKPCVLASSKILPQDGAPGNAKLNAAELNGAAPQLVFSLDPACKDVDLSTLDATTPVQVREVSAGTLSGSFALPADVHFSSGTFTVNLTQGVASEKDYVFFLVLRDLAGNTNTDFPLTDPARFPVRIDTVAPTCSITTPSASQTLLGSAQVPSGQFGVTVATSSDVVASGVRMTLSASGQTDQTATPTPSNGQATNTFTVTGTHDWTVASICTDESGNKATATPRLVTIDLDNPTCTISSPVPNTALTAYGDNQIQTNLTVTGADGRQVSCTANGTALTPSFLVSSGAATAQLTYPNGTLTVVCSVSDLAGNPGSCQVTPVWVNSTGCSLSSNAVQANGNFWFNGSNTTPTGANTATATVTASSPDCGTMKAVTLARLTPTANTPTVLPTDALGNVSFTGVAFTDGEVWRLTIDNGGGVKTSQTFNVGLVAPAVATMTIDSAPVATGAPALTFVAPTGNHNIELGTAGYLADQDGATAGAQLTLQVNNVTGGRKFGLDGTAQLWFKGALVSSLAVSADPQSLTFSAQTLPQNSSGTLELRVIDAAGNQSTVLSKTASVDVIAPGAPTVTQSVTGAHTGTVTLVWSPTYDDGTDSASNGHQGYDVRWTSLAIPGITASGIVDSTTYFGSLVKQETAEPWSANPIVRVLTLPPLNTYFIQVRAYDEVGNYSPIVPSAVQSTAPAALPNWWTPVLLTNPVASTGYAGTVVAANLTSDSLQEIAVSATSVTGGGAVYVYYGSATLADQATCTAPACTTLAPSDATAGAFGSDVSSDGNVGDVTGETARNDLVIGQTWTGGGLAGRVVLYFGTSTGTALVPANAIEFRGDIVANASNKIGATARIIKDINADGLDELAIACPACNANHGRIYIYKGRPRDGATGSWDALRTATDATTLVKYVPVSQATADFAIDGDLSLLYSGGNALGQNRHGLLSVGDINADGVPDVAIPMSRSIINRYRIYSGAAIAASTGNAPLAAASFILELTQTAGTDTNSLNGFGATAASTDLIGATAADLAVAYPGVPGGGHLYLYGDPVAGAAPSPAWDLLGPLTFGFKISAGSINGDSLKDFLVGEGLASSNVAWIVYQQTGVRPFDGTGASHAIGTTPEFWVSKFDGTTIAGTSVTGLGISNAIGDVDGVNGNDIILGDNKAGQVRIWR